MLKSLDFGTSPIQNKNRAAVYLSEICPLSCEVETEVAWNNVLKNDVMNEGGLAAKIQERREGWKHVRDILPTLIAVRHEERARSQDLEKEVQDLRMWRASAHNLPTSPR
ncbi:hypothetical protein BD410DRAFT_830394 [Rickenella mellea]|uniref:Uncharacterized protein n=1 Tax=Rickenella mellea TaxID=50990 RepID=A0A4Y7PV02_9AGAM|nr:hypothetical protein BD410DRAFT_830394 [Rickenella mellea]